MKSIAEIATKLLGRRSETLTDRERRVLQSALDRRTIARNTHKAYVEQLTLGDRLADAIARIGGSWGFILAFLAMLALWSLANSWLLGRDSFDPYPYIFLNLLLSMLAAIQAPVIMMSQNRQAARDRIDAAHDYEVNLKAEIEIMALHDKFDALRHQELMAMNADVSEIAAALKRIEGRLGKAGATPRRSRGRPGRGSAE